MGCSNRSKQHTASNLHALTSFEGIAIPVHRRRARSTVVVWSAQLHFWIIGSSTWVRMHFCMSRRTARSLVVKVMMWCGITRIIRCPPASNRTAVAIRLLKERSLSSLEGSSARTATRKNDTRKWGMLRKQVLVRSVLLAIAWI